MTILKGKPGVDLLRQQKLVHHREYPKLRAPYDGQSFAPLPSVDSDDFLNYALQMTVF